MDVRTVPLLWPPSPEKRREMLSRSCECGAGVGEVCRNLCRPGELIAGYDLHAARRIDRRKKK